MSNSNQKFMYRFRSTKALLTDYKELEKQEIYFSSPEDLNDPIEGFKDIFWSGDEIVWRNLLKNYLLCLERTCTLFLLGDETENFDEKWIPVFNTEKDLPTEIYKNLYREICKNFFQIEEIIKYQNFFSSRRHPIRRKELLSHLRQLHESALNVIYTAYENNGLMPASANPIQKSNRKEINTKILDSISDLDKNEKTSSLAEKMCEVEANINAQMHLILTYNNRHQPLDKKTKMLFFEFPESYIKILEKIVHPPWYTVCFTDNCNNPSMWGHYGDCHKGVCLKFKTYLVKDKPLIKLQGLKGWGSNQQKSWPVYGDRNHQFYKVDYVNKYPEIDFFNSLGSLPKSTLNAWYSDEEKNSSRYGTAILRDSENWRKQYWELFQKSITTKLEDWSYEKEYRLVIHQILLDFSKPDDRKMKYNFNDLEGIIFGIKTSEHDKLEIMKIIEKKCQKEGRQDFKFFQAFYSRETGKIETSEMKMLKLK